MKKKLVGIVTSDKMNKSLRVEIERRFAHPMYGKIVRGRTVCHVHDEENIAHTGDTVEIIECRPRSKTKRWDLVRVVKSPVLAGAELKPQDDSLDTTTAEPTETTETAVSANEQ